MKERQRKITYIRTRTHTHTHTQKEAETNLIWPQAQKYHKKPEATKAVRGKEQNFPIECGHFDFRLCPSETERINVCCFTRPSLH